MGEAYHVKITSYLRLLFPIQMMSNRRSKPKQHGECPVQHDGVYICDCPHGCVGRNLDFSNWMKEIEEISSNAKIDGWFRVKWKNGDICWYYNGIQYSETCMLELICLNCL
ncbi:Axotactin [Trichinella spiralis]|uniref:Axotactin n=1 Tax=Trichinella spiralis TaxID=6334 RepID=A0ABR3K7G4_TRISP